MRFISIKDKKTRKIKIVCIAKGARLIGVSRGTIYNWAESSNEKEFRDWIVNFVVHIF